MHGARTASTARAVHVEEHGAVAFAQERTVDPAQRPANALEDASRDVTGDDRVRHARQPSVPQMDVGAAHLRTDRPQQRAAWRQVGTLELADLDGLPRCGHHGGEDAGAHVVRYS